MAKLEQKTRTSIRREEGPQGNLPARMACTTDTTGCVSRPLEAVQAAFAFARGKGGVDAAGWEQDVENHFAELTKVPASIPSLNDTHIDRLQPGSLVRYRCMIQDVRDPEYYMGLYQHTDVTSGETVVTTAKYRDAVPSHSQTMENVAPEERLPLYCVPIPSESAWAKNDYAAVGSAGAPAAPALRTTGLKRPASDSPEEMSGPDSASQRCKPCGGTGAASAPGAHTPAAAVAASAGGATAHHRSMTVGACLVKVYRADDAHQMRVHDTYEFVGVLAVEPELATFEAAASIDSWPTEQADSEPHSALPRVHAICCRKVNPVTEPCCSPTEVEAMAAAMSPTLTLCGSTVPLRDGFVNLAAAALGGDRLAAEYVHSAVDFPLSTMRWLNGLLGGCLQVFVDALHLGDLPPCHRALPRATDA